MDYNEWASREMPCRWSSPTADIDLVNPALPLPTVAAVLPGNMPAALLHVKWFGEFSFSDRPLGLLEMLTPTFLALLALGVVAVSAAVWIERFLARAGWYRAVNDWLAARREHGVLVMRIATGAVLLLSWQAGSALAPELHAQAPWVGWYQFALALLLLFGRTVPLAGAGMIALFLLGAADRGWFYLLDYLAYAGAGYFLLAGAATDPRIRGSALPALYLAVGLSLCWLALEKMVYPQWGLYLLQQNPQLALGMDPHFFLLSAAFVEFSLGYLLVIGLLERPLALVITLVFFTTTLVFGKVEVIGHTLLHGALIVFLLEGTGTVYRAPIDLHRRPGLRTAFAAVNFVLLLALLALPYTAGARVLHREYRQEEPAAPDRGEP